MPEGGERIKAAAIQFEDGEIFTGPQHRLIIQYIIEETGRLPNNGREGFITNTGRFVSRMEAATIAYTAKQIKKPKGKLYSEDLRLTENAETE